MPEYLVKYVIEVVGVALLGIGIKFLKGFVDAQTAKSKDDTLRKFVEDTVKYVEQTLPTMPGASKLAKSTELYIGEFNKVWGKLPDEADMVKARVQIESVVNTLSATKK